jgi:hypothetical protein
MLQFLQSICSADGTFPDDLMGRMKDFCEGNPALKAATKVRRECCVVSLPVSAVSLPVSAVFLPVSAVSLPVSAVSLPGSAVSLPVSAVSLPVSAVSVPFPLVHP